MPLGLLRLAARSAAPPDGLADAHLLDRFAAGGDEAAFAALVERHGPTVLGVCRRVLGDTPDADDAFQATFLVLVRRANAVRDRDRLAGWLYGVAYRTALAARTRRAKRWRREAPTDPVPDAPAPAAGGAEAAELAAVIDREVHRLPAKYRAAVVLCDLDGRPRAEAARLLGVPEGTLSSRLAAGRKRLAGRLARRGLAVAGVAAAVAVPAPLAGAAVRAAAGGGPPLIHELATGVTRAMIASKLKLGGLLAAAPVAALLAAGWATGGERRGLSPPSDLTAGINPAARPEAAAAAPAAPAQDDEFKKRSAEAGKKAVADAPPAVVKTVPAAGAEDVDPDLAEVKVTFSKEMGTKGWSWATDLRYGADVPSAGKVRFDADKKTCVLPCKLAPGTTYAVWINSGKFNSFRDPDGTPSVPYLLVFRTKEKK